MNHARLLLLTFSIIYGKFSVCRRSQMWLMRLWHEQTSHLFSATFGWIDFWALTERQLSDSRKRQKVLQAVEAFSGKIYSHLLTHMLRLKQPKTICFYNRKKGKKAKLLSPCESGQVSLKGPARIIIKRDDGNLINVERNSSLLLDFFYLELFKAKWRINEEMFTDMMLAFQESTSTLRKYSNCS